MGTSTFTRYRSLSTLISRKKRSVDSKPKDVKIPDFLSMMKTGVFHEIDFTKGNEKFIESN